MCKGEKPIGAAKGKHTKTMASCQTPQSGTQVWGGGGRGFKIKKFIGDDFVSRWNDFKRGWTFDIIHWGMLCE